MNNKEIFALIDSNALIHRAYHAYPSTLTTSKGEQINAVFGFASMLLRVLEEIKPVYIACAFDLPKPTFRHLEYTGYKADRCEPDKELIPQFDNVRRVVDALNMPIFQVEGYEADDVIGTLCRQIDELDPENQVDTIIVTGDKDALQLIDANTKVWLPGKTFKDMQLYDEGRVHERFGLTPKQIIDLKALAGDPSDQIPGVRGIGEKGAVKLIQGFGSVEGIYENIESVPKRYQKLLIDDQESAFLSKKLSTIVKEVPIKLNYEAAVLADYDYDKTFKLFQEFEFRSLINRLPNSTRKINRQYGLFGDEEKKDEVKDIKTSENYLEIDDLKNFNDFLNILSETKEFALFPLINNENIEGFAFSWEKWKAYYISFQLLLENEEEFNKLLNILEDKKVLKAGYDIKTALHAFDSRSLTIRGFNFDVRIAAYLLGFLGGNLELKSLAFGQFGLLLEDIKKIEVDEYSKYGCISANAIWRLYKLFQKNLEEKDKIAGKVWKKLVKGEHEHLLALPDYRIGVKDLFYKVEMPLVKVLKKMEIMGIRVDQQVLEKLNQKFTKEIAEIEQRIYQLVGHEFNIASSKQLADIMFIELQLPPGRRTKTGYSTAAAILSDLRGLHPIIEYIEKYRELTKLKSTYIDGLLPLIKKDGRVHTSYNQTVAITGRLSSSNPNLQNIPIRTEIGNEIRKAFIAPEDGFLIGFDYSQIELRLASHVAGEEKMLKAFANGKDIHAATAAEIFNISLDKVTKAKRRIAKTVNFAVLYGISPFGLSQQLKINQKEASEIINLYFSEYPQISNYFENVIKIARENGYLETMFGRLAQVKNIDSSNASIRRAAERFAINFPMQGSASDIMKLAMIEVNKKVNQFKKDNQKIATNILLQVHDELVFEYFEDGKTRKDLFTKGEIQSKYLKKFIRIVEEAMENIIELTVPILAGVEIGENWGEMKEVKL